MRKKIRVYGGRPRYAKQQGMRLKKRSSIPTWSEEMNSNTLIGFEEWISSMGSCLFEEDRFSKTLKSGQNDGGGRWKGCGWWEAIATSEKEFRWIEELMKKIM